MTPGDDKAPRAARCGSGDGGGQRAEAAAVWRKSSYSASNGGQCVEVGRCLPEIVGLPAIVAVRDSTDPDGARLTVPRAAWAAFVGRVKRDGCLVRVAGFRRPWWPTVIAGPAYLHQVPE